MSSPVSRFFLSKEATKICLANWQCPYEALVAAVADQMEGKLMNFSVGQFPALMSVFQSPLAAPL